MSEEKNEKVGIKEIIELICEKFTDLNDDRWKECLKFIFIMYVTFLRKEELSLFLEERGWTSDELEEEGEKYVEGLIPELNNF